ncbi:siderophore-interacting protein [Yinghuangia sp. YIM S10712]|uniref:siderophore-interacting protein n=1 Tax=Yinghuangia sp. YIM S10712 TaxID=3436930 RepID=UPI003F5364CB
MSNPSTPGAGEPANPPAAPARRGRAVIDLVVRETRWLTPHMVRVTAGGDAFARFVDNGYTDAYVKVLFPRPGVTYPEPFDMQVIRAEMPREQWPQTRTYTVRDINPVARELSIDFVYHGDEGLAGPWAAGAKPGDPLRLLGPGGAYAPGPDADWHLFVGDEAALPAIAVSLARVPEGVPVRALIEVASPEEEQELTTAGDARITWLHRSNGSSRLAEALRAMDFPPGRVQAFVHGEADTVKVMRRHLLDERGVARDDLSVSGYWRRGRDEDGFQADKAAEREAGAN